MDAARVLQRTALASATDFFSSLTPKIYFISWLPRVLFQLAFFGLIADFIGGAELLAFALVGGVAQATYFTVISWVTASVSYERGHGVLPLLLATPSDPLIALTGRNVAWIVHGVLSGVFTLVAAMVVLHISPEAFRLTGVLLALIVIALSAYAFGLLIGSVGLRWNGWQNVLSILTSLPLTILGGVYFPVSELPEWGQRLGDYLPAKHGVASLREMLARGWTEVALREAALELVIGVAFLFLAEVSMRILIVRARQAGTLDFH